MDLGQLCKQLHTALEPHGEVELALLFGSRARGEVDPGSDVDVAVVGSAIDTIGLGIELVDAIGMQVDVVDLSGDPPTTLVQEVLRDGGRVYETAGAYGQFSRSYADEARSGLAGASAHAARLRASSG